MTGAFEFGSLRVEPSLTVMGARFPDVAARVGAVYGLRLPRHMAVFAAFLDAIGDAGRRALYEEVGLRSGGISRYFEDGGLALHGRDGLDERLHCRFRRDPPEFVTVMWGDTDGLHYGLWYDDPAEPPSFVAYNYARDTAETWTDHLATPLDQVLNRMDRVEEDIAQDPGHEYLGAQDRQELRRACLAFHDADRRAYAQDGGSRWRDVARPAILGGPGPALPEGAGELRAGYARYDARYQGYRARSPQVREWIAEAEADLAAGMPAFALVLGRELHWFDDDDYRPDSLRLLAGAYRALGRDALADITAVHHANRDLGSVDVLTR
jgi:hypothetical protein